MAERVITVEMNVDASGVGAGLAEADQELINLTEQIAEVEDGLRNLSKEAAKGEAAKSFEKLNKIVEENVLSIQELGAAADNYKNIALAAGVSSPIGQEALKRAAAMEKQMDKVNQEVTQLAEGGRQLNTAMQIGTGVIAGYTAFQGVTALLGEESEELQETFIKLQAAQSVLMGIKELSIALDKKGLIATTAQAAATTLLSAATAAYSVVVGGTTGMLKLFRLALAATGIGAIIIGIALLITNFDLVKEAIISAVDWLLNMSDVVLLLLGPIGLLIILYKRLFKTVEDESTAAERLFAEQAAAENKRHEERLAQIDKEKNARIEAADATIEATKRQIEINANIGESTDALAIQVLEAEAEKVRAVLDANAKILQASIDHFKELARLRGESDQEFIDAMKAQGLDLEKLQEEANAVLAENEQNVLLAESRITKFKREQGQKRADEAKAINDKILEEQRIAMEKQLALEAKITELLLANMEEGAEKELAILQDKQGRERDALIAEHGENAELLEQLDIAQEKELLDLQKKFNDERLALEDEFIELLIDMRLENLEEGREKELAILKRKHEQELEEIRRKFGEGTELEKELLLKQKREIKEAEDEFDEQANAEKLERAQAVVDEIQKRLDQANEINDILNEIGDRRKAKIEKQSDEELGVLDRQKKAELQREGLTANQRIAINNKFAQQEFDIKKKTAEATDKINRRAFNREKAFKLAQIGIDTASGIVKALASAPPPLNFINAGIVGAIGAAQAVIVATKRFEGSAGSIQPPNFESPSIEPGGGDDSTTAGGAGGDQENVTTATDDLINPPIIISQVEINKVQGELAQIDEISTL